MSIFNSKCKTDPEKIIENVPEVQQGEETKLGKLLYDFKAEQDREISCKKGEIAYIIAHDGEWTKIRKKNKRTGYAPTNFVEVLLMGVVLFDFKKDSKKKDNKEVSVKAGEIVYIIEQAGEWTYIGKLSNDKVGFVPRNFIDIK